jgi:RNA polymerase sigma-70 factor (ECF subfamily)
MQTTTFHGLYEAHARDVWRFARYLTGSADAADDITAETFLRAWAGRERVRVTTARAYLLAIARNLAADRARAGRRWADVPVPVRTVEPNAETTLELSRALDAVRALPPQYREPLTLVASGLSYQEAGEVLGLSISTVKIRVHRARLKLVSPALSSGGS